MALILNPMGTAEKLARSYQGDETPDATVKADALGALANIVQFMQSRCPVISFNPVDDTMSKDYDGNYYLIGCYEGRFLWVLPEDRFVQVLWGKDFNEPADHCQKFLPKVRFDKGACNQFESLSELEVLMDKYIRLPR